MDQSFDAMIKLHNASSAVSARQQQLQQQALPQNQRPSKEGFFQNLYVSELKKSLEPLMQQQQFQQLQQQNIPQLHQKLHLPPPSPDRLSLGRASFSTPPPAILPPGVTPPLMAPKKRQVT